VNVLHLESSIKEKHPSYIDEKIIKLMKYTSSVIVNKHLCKEPTVAEKDHLH
jgi:hypothetical protein